MPNGGRLGAARPQMRAELAPHRGPAQRGAPENTLARAPEIGRSAADDVTGRGAWVPAGPFKGALADAHRPLERRRQPRSPFWIPLPPPPGDVENEREGATLPLPFRALCLR